MKVRSHINLTVAFLLLTQLMLGVLRVQIVPLGWNVDEIIHFAHTRLVAAACLRDTVGLPWSLHREDSEIGENVTELMAFNKEELTKVYPRDSQSSPCELLFDKRRLTNSGYYIWAGLPMAIFNDFSDRTTINLGRLATLVLGVIATTLTYSTARNLFPKNHLIHIGAASIMALNHQQGDITSGLNTDAGATFAISLLFWTLSGFSMNNIKFGSVFKTFTLAAGLQNGVIDQNTMFTNLKHKIFCAGQEIFVFPRCACDPCIHQSGWGPLGLTLRQLK